MEVEFIPCKKFEELEEKYQNAFRYCRKKIHHLNFYPSRKKKNFPCQEAKVIIKDFLDKINSDIIFYKGGNFEKKISTDIGVDSFNIEQFGVKKVNSHDPKDEIYLHYKHIENIVNDNKYIGF